jgi:mannose-1-phosphate guanylyltransferase
MPDATQTGSDIDLDTSGRIFPDPAHAALGPRARNPLARTRRWGVILAGGDGIRLQSLTRLICGDDRPKQFCPLLDGGTLLEHTVCRAERSIPPGQLLFALTHAHRDFYVHDLDGFESQRIVQPANKGTAPPILFSALSIEKVDEDALIAVLPSDHYYSDEACFTIALESAFETAARHPESVVLLVAQTLRDDQFLWNTFVMVGHVRAFLAMAAQAIPVVLEGVRRAELWTGSETYIEQFVYNNLLSSDFSRQVLSQEAMRLLVLRVRHLGWRDLGHPSRVLHVLEESGSKPRWLTKELRNKMTAALPLGAESAVA